MDKLIKDLYIVMWLHPKLFKATVVLQGRNLGSGTSVHIDWHGGYVTTCPHQGGCGLSQCKLSSVGKIFQCKLLVLYARILKSRRTDWPGPYCIEGSLLFVFVSMFIVLCLFYLRFPCSLGNKWQVSTFRGHPNVLVSKWENYKCYNLCNVKNKYEANICWNILVLYEN